MLVVSGFLKRFEQKSLRDKVENGLVIRVGWHDGGTEGLVVTYSMTAGEVIAVRLSSDGRLVDKIKLPDRHPKMYGRLKKLAEKFPLHPISLEEAAHMGTGSFWVFEYLDSWGGVISNVYMEGVLNDADLERLKEVRIALEELEKLAKKGQYSE